MSDYRIGVDSPGGTAFGSVFGGCMGFMAAGIVAVLTLIILGYGCVAITRQ